MLIVSEFSHEMHFNDKHKNIHMATVRLSELSKWLALSNIFLVAFVYAICVRVCIHSFF